MNLVEITNRIGLIKEKTVDKIDHHFSEYVVADILGQTELESLIDEMDWYGYWKEVAMDIKFVIDDLLEYTGLVDSKGVLAYNKGSLANNFLKEVIGYKMICDKNLRSNKYYDLGNVEEEVFGIKNEIGLSGILPPLTIVDEKHKDEIIHIIYTFMVKNKFIKEEGFENFEFLFKTESKPTLIKWEKDAITFVAFINVLIDNEVIELPLKFKDKNWEYFRRVFLDQNRKPFSTKHLGNRRAQSTYSKKEKEIRNELIHTLITNRIAD